MVTAAAVFVALLRSTGTVGLMRIAPVVLLVSLLGLTACSPAPEGASDQSSDTTAPAPVTEPASSTPETSGTAPSTTYPIQSGPGRNMCVGEVCTDDLPASFTALDDLHQTLAHIRQRIGSPEVTLPERAACHEVLHAVGRSAAMSEFSYAEMLGNFDNTCASAYIHGVMERFSHDMSLAELNEATDEFCGLFPEGKIALCWHGYGHAIGYHETTDFTRQLNSCGYLGEQSVTYCVSGVFMAAAERPSEYIQGLVPDGDYCKDLSGEYLRSCAEQQWNLFARFDIPASQMLDRCEAAPVGDGKDFCFRGLGQLLYAYALADALHSNQPDAVRVRPELCESFGDQRENCLFGTARYRAGIFLGAGYPAEFYQSICGELDVDQTECRRVEQLVANVG